MKQIHGAYIFDRNVRTDVAYSRPVRAIYISGSILIAGSHSGSMS
jgi:hypothetical protein